MKRNFLTTLAGLSLLVTGCSREPEQIMRIETKEVVVSGYVYDKFHEMNRQSIREISFGFSSNGAREMKHSPIVRLPDNYRVILFSAETGAVRVIEGVSPECKSIYDCAQIGELVDVTLRETSKNFYRIKDEKEILESSFSQSKEYLGITSQD